MTIAEKIQIYQTNIETLTKQLLTDFRDEKIKNIDSKDYNIKMDYRTLQRLLEEIGFVTMDDTSFNGWENDYWETYTYKNRQIHVFGTMADGRFLIN